MIVSYYDALLGTILIDDKVLALREALRETVQKYNPNHDSKTGEFTSVGDWTHAEGHEPPASSRREAHLTSRVKSSSKLGGGMNVTKLVEFKEGGQGVFKPNDGEHPGLRDEISDGQQTAREVGAWEVAKIVGMDDLVSPAVEAEVGGKRGAMLEYQEGDTANTFYDTSRKYDGPTDLARSAIFDYVIGNEDRHDGNWLVGPTDKLRLIDHGLSFPDKAQYRTYNAMFLERAKGTLDGEDVAPGKFSEPFLKNADKIYDRLDSLGLKKAIPYMKERMEKLKNATKWGDLYHYGYGY